MELFTCIIPPEEVIAALAEGDEHCFDPAKFVSAVARQDAAALEKFFLPDAIIRWHDSNEEFTVPEYIRANCEYPGAWGGQLQRVEATDSGVAMVTKIFSDEMTVLVTAFVTLTGGKISLLDEYYCDYNDDTPQWRKDMKIGRAIT